MAAVARAKKKPTDRILDPVSGRRMQRGRPVEAAHAKPPPAPVPDPKYHRNKNVRVFPDNRGNRLLDKANRAQDPVWGGPMRRGKPVETLPQTGLAPLGRQLSQGLYDTVGRARAKMKKRKK